MGNINKGKAVIVDTFRCINKYFIHIYFKTLNIYGVNTAGLYVV